MTRNADVVILQEYVTHYRVPFFREVRMLAREAGFSVAIAAGTPSGARAERGDAAVLEDVRPIRQHELRVARRRIALRRVGPVIQDAQLIVLEQARRNLDIYRLFLPRHRKVALWGHGWDQTHSPSAIERGLLDALTRRCDWFFGYTDTAVEHAVSVGVDRRRTTVVQNSTDTRQLAADLAEVTPAGLDEWRSQHDLRGRTALFLGTVDRSKRIDLLLDAALRVYRQDSEFRLLIAGSGEALDSVREFAAQNPWCSALGSVVGARRALALKSADVLAIPGRVGLVAVDSLTAATPIVTVAASSHAPEFRYLTPDVNCLATADSAAAYAAGLHSALFDRQRLTVLQHGCVEPSRLFSVEDMASRFVAGLGHALDNPPPAGEPL